jgi:hypothetical protein
MNTQSTSIQLHTLVLQFSGMWHHVVQYMGTNVSEKHAASIFRVEGDSYAVLHPNSHPDNLEFIH